MPKTIPTRSKAQKPEAKQESLQVGVVVHKLESLGQSRLYTG